MQVKKMNNVIATEFDILKVVSQNPSLKLYTWVVTHTLHGVHLHA